MNFTIGFSPCPNDTFIFDALVNQKIDTEGISFEVVLEDVQTLNEWATRGKLTISKISYGVLPLVLHQYIVLPSGGALGKGVGPLLISKPTEPPSTIPTDIDLHKKIAALTVAIPGENTTANLLFSMAFPTVKKKVYLLFHEIEGAVISGKVDAGVIIHENRFTYQQNGLEKLVDLGTYWEESNRVPIPLGGIVIKRTVDQALQQKINRLIKQSVDYAFSNYPSIPPYVKQHAQEMNETVMRQHIDLYVNNYSRNLGVHGKQAVNKLMEVYYQLHPKTAIAHQPLFLP